MQLEKIRITNYRCFKEVDIDLDEHTTLIVGKNGAGKTAILDAVAVAVSTFLLEIDGGVSRSISKDDAKYEFHDLDIHRLVLNFESTDGSLQKFAMDEMSDGYKNTLSMLGDIAYRMAVLNPMLGDRVLEETPRVAVIDEIDLHLHPQWQQTIFCSSMSL